MEISINTLRNDGRDGNGTVVPEPVSPGGQNDSPGDENVYEAMMRRAAESAKTMRSFKKAVRAGKVRALGISNFDANDSVFNLIMEKAEIKPVALQIECHPYAQRLDIRKKVAEYGLQVECWFPLGGATRYTKNCKDKCT